MLPSVGSPGVRHDLATEQQCPLPVRHLVLTLGRVTRPCLGLSAADKFNSAFLLRGRWPSRHSSRPALGTEGCLRRPTTTHTFTPQWPGQGPALVTLLLKVEAHGFYSREASSLVWPCCSRPVCSRGQEENLLKVLWGDSLQNQLVMMAADEDVANSLKVWQLLWGTLHESPVRRLITRRGSMAPSVARPGYREVFCPAGHTSPGGPKAGRGPSAALGPARVPSPPPSFPLPASLSLHLFPPFLEFLSYKIIVYF